MGRLSGVGGANVASAYSPIVWCRTLTQLSLEPVLRLYPTRVGGRRAGRSQYPRESGTQRRRHERPICSLQIGRSATWGP